MLRPSAAAHLDHTEYALPHGRIRLPVGRNSHARSSGHSNVGIPTMSPSRQTSEPVRCSVRSEIKINLGVFYVGRVLRRCRIESGHGGPLLRALHRFVAVAAIAGRPIRSSMPFPATISAITARHTATTAIRHHHRIGNIPHSVGST